jgi:hypothetical protein
MEKELSLKEMIHVVILFFINFRNIIIITTFLGTLSVVIYQKARPAYFNTTAIAISGLSSFERIDTKSDLNQRVAVDLINLLDIDVKKSDFILLSKKMNISLDDASSIKSIKAKEIFYKDKDDKRHHTSKFFIDLVVDSYSTIANIQDGFDYYFKNNLYVKQYYNQFVSTTSKEIEAIDLEVNSLRSIRESDNSNIDVSSININSRKSAYDVNNQILELISLKSKNITDLALLRPLSFVSPFTTTQMAERGVLFLGSVTALVSSLIGIIIAVFRSVYVNSKE